MTEHDDASQDEESDSLSATNANHALHILISEEFTSEKVLSGSAPICPLVEYDQFQSPLIVCIRDCKSGLILSVEVKSHLCIICWQPDNWRLFCTSVVSFLGQPIQDVLMICMQGVQMFLFDGVDLGEEHVPVVLLVGANLFVVEAGEDVALDGHVFALLFEVSHI